MTDEYILNDEKLAQNLEPGKVDEIAKAFSSGNFQSITQMITQELIEKYNEDLYTKQILLSILVYSLIKCKKYDEAKKLFTDYESIIKEIMIFPLSFLKAKLYIAQSETTLAIIQYNEILTKYENYNVEQEKNNKNNVITVETFLSKFTKFYNFFNFLFAINNIDSKIKKIYFEIKNCLKSVDYNNESYEMIKKLYNKYPDDLVVQFEYAKDTIMFSMIDEYNTILQKMKEDKGNCTDEKRRKVYENYINYLEGLSQFAMKDYEKTRDCFINLSNNNPNNIVYLNNAAVMNIYCEKIKDSITSLDTIINPKKMNSGNDTIQANYETVSKEYGITKI